MPGASAMRLLLTGGLGFQGHALAEHWTAMGHAVTVLNTPSQRAQEMAGRLTPPRHVLWGSVTDPELMRKAVRGVDAVVHLAAWTSVDESFHHPRAVWEVNAQAAYTVLEAIRSEAPAVRVLWASSCEVYGYTGAAAVDELAPLVPHSPYAAAKCAGERLAEAYAITYGLRLTILRPCNIFGPWQKTGRDGAVIPTFLAAARAGGALQLTGDGSQRREFLFIDDLVAAYALLLEADDLPWRVFNVGSGESCSIRDIADFLSARYDVPIVARADLARPGEVVTFHLNCDRLRSLGWKPRTSFRMGLEQVLAWAEGEGSEWGR